MPRHLRPAIRTTPAILLAACLSVAPLTAQEQVWRQHASIGGGAAVPGADLRPFMSPSFLLRLNYAYRFHRNLQVESGLDSYFGAARVDRVENSAVGDIRIADSEYVVPFGVRAVLPLAHNRFELGAGGGGAYIFYGEEARQPEGVAVYCPYGGCAVIVDCKTCKSRSGWGYYGLVGASFSLDAQHRLWLGVTGRFLRGTTSGQTLGTLSRIETKDQWFAAVFDITYRF